MESARVQQTENYREPSLFLGQVMTRRVDELQPHPSFLRHQITVQAPELSALAQRGDSTFQEPLAITRDHMIMDGLARWELARLQGRLTLPCVEYDLTEAEALQWLLQRHLRSNGLNAFTRIILALDLEPWYKERALSNQQAGGRNKGSSKLTEADRLDVRSAIAAAADVSAGNVTKVKQLKTAAHVDIFVALRSGEITIHRAWTWCKLAPNAQSEALWRYRSERGINKKIRQLVSRHLSAGLPEPPDAATLVKKLAGLRSDKLGAVKTAVAQEAGQMILVTEELLNLLFLDMDICGTSNR